MPRRNLHYLNNAECIRQLWENFNKREFGAAKKFLSENFIACWPQTKEVIKGRDKFIDLNQNYPGDWHCHVECVFQDGENVISFVKIINGAEKVYATSFYEFKGGKAIRAVELFADEIEPPFDRSNWAQRFDGNMDNHLLKLGFGSLLQFHD